MERKRIPFVTLVLLASVRQLPASAAAGPAVKTVESTVARVKPGDGFEWRLLLGGARDAMSVAGAVVVPDDHGGEAPRAIAPACVKAATLRRDTVVIVARETGVDGSEAVGGFLALLSSKDGRWRADADVVFRFEPLIGEGGDGTAEPGDECYPIPMWARRMLVIAVTDCSALLLIEYADGELDYVELCCDIDGQWTCYCPNTGPDDCEVAGCEWPFCLFEDCTLPNTRSPWQYARWDTVIIEFGTHGEPVLNTGGPAPEPGGVAVPPSLPDAPRSAAP